MVSAAPRIDPRVRRVARRLSRKPLSTADIHRSVGAYAVRLGVARPSYEQIRLVVNEARFTYLARRATRQLLVEAYFGARPVSDLYELLEE